MKFRGMFGSVGYPVVCRESDLGFSSESESLTSSPTTSQGAQVSGANDVTPTIQQGANSTAQGANSEGSLIVGGSSSATGAGSTGSVSLGGAAKVGGGANSTTIIQSDDPTIAGDAIVGNTLTATSALLDNSQVAEQANLDVSAISTGALEALQVNTASTNQTTLASENSALGSVNTNVGNALATVNNTTLASLEEASDATEGADELTATVVGSEADTASQSLSLAGNIAGDVGNAVASGINQGDANADTLLEELTTQYAAGLNQASNNSQTVANNAVGLANNALTAGVAPSETLQGIDQDTASDSVISPGWQKIAFWAGLAATGLALYFYIVKKKA